MSTGSPRTRMTVRMATKAQSVHECVCALTGYGGWADEYVTFPRERSPLAQSAMLCRNCTSRVELASAHCT
eukprot:3643908-Prymnesium_polylepis.1